MVAGLVGMPAAHASGGSITVAPATGISDPGDIQVTLDGFTHNALANVQIAQCGNAYANLAPLPARPPVTFGVLDERDCEPIGFLSQGNMNTSPVNVAGLTDTNPTVHQTGIGQGNRSCIPAPPAVAPCFVYVSTSVNLPSFPETDITFANLTPTSSDPAATTTTVTPVGSPVAVGKIAHAYVQVTAADPSLRPDGTVQVFEDGSATPAGSADLDANGTASVAIGSPSLGLHTLTASFGGNGSFAASSTTTSSTLSIVPANNVSIGDATIIEGDSHTLRNIAFPVVLSTPSTLAPVVVNYSVVPLAPNPPTIGKATDAGTQVVAQAKTLIFKPNTQTVKYITVKVFGDTQDLGDETFGVQLTMSPLDTSGYVIRRGLGNGLIIGDDHPTASNPVLSIGNSSVPEGDVGSARSLKFAVTLSKAAAATVTVPVTVFSGTAVHGNALSGDWGGMISRKLVFKSGQVTKFIVVACFPDTTSELDKTVNVSLGTITTADGTVTLGSHNTAVGTIMSDE
jgi:hypothetical protein